MCSTTFLHQLTTFVLTAGKGAGKSKQAYEEAAKKIQTKFKQYKQALKRQEKARLASEDERAKAKEVSQTTQTFSTSRFIDT
jgi:hypothetical protein